MKTIPSKGRQFKVLIDKYENEIYKVKKNDLGMGKTSTYLTAIFGIKAGKNKKKSQTLLLI